MTTVAVIGIGYWGKKLVQCFSACATVKYCCHTGTSENADWILNRFPEITLTESYDRIITDDTVDAVVIATPISTHSTLVRRALQADKHVFVEKPLANSASEARSLVELAAEHELSLFTGYVFLYSPAMQKLHQEIQDDPAAYIRSTWQKFGSFAAPIEYSLACHDIAIGIHLFGESFTKATVIERVSVISEADLFEVKYQSVSNRELVAHYDRTARTTQKSIIVVTESGEKYEFADDRLYKLYNKKYEDLTPNSDKEPLLYECKAFIEWVEGGSTPTTGGEFGAEINTALELL